MPKLPLLRVFANPWHAPLDHNHRANHAVAWDPTDNPDRIHVGADHRVDADGELYFEFRQFDHDLNLVADAKPIDVPATDYFKARVREHALLAADEQTWRRATGSKANYVPFAQKLAWDREAQLAARKSTVEDEGEDFEPKARPKVGEGRVGHVETARIIQTAPTGMAPVDAARGALAKVIADGAKVPTPNALLKPVAPAAAPKAE